MFIVKNLLDKLCFAAFLLLGIQLPNFVIQYQQNLNAHYLETHRQLHHYQDIADRFFAGDMDKLLETHQQNAVAAIRAESELISSLILRHDYLQHELKALQGKTVLEQLFHLVRHLDVDVANEVIQQYSFTIPLNMDAITVGLILAFVGNFILYILVAVISYPFRRKSHEKAYH